MTKFCGVESRGIDLGFLKASRNASKLEVYTEQELTFLLYLQVSWLARQEPEDRLTSIILIFPTSETAVGTGRRDRPEETRGLREAQRKDLRGNLVEILGNLSAEAQGMATSLGIRNLAGSLARVTKKVKAKTSLAVTELQGVAIRMDAPARRGNIRLCDFRLDHLQTTLIFVLLS